MTIAKQDFERVLGLDILRAYAILSVLYGHAFELIRQILSPSLWTAYWAPVWDGVTLFFVLSGFLIGRIILKECTSKDPKIISLFEFWILRWLRTIPPYAIVITIIVSIYWATGKSNPSGWWKYYLFLQNINQPHPEAFAEAWSLAVEEWFYLGAPIGFWLIYIYAKSKKTAALNLILLTIGACAAYHAATYITHPITNFDEWNANLRNVVISRLGSIMIGVLAAYIEMYKQELWLKARHTLLYSGILILIFDKAIVTTNYTNGVGVFYLSIFNLTITPVGFALLLPYFSRLSRRSDGRLKLPTNIITYISKISYSLYLVNHELVRQLLFGLAIQTLNIHLANAKIAIIIYILYYIVSILMAIILWKAIENPIMDYRKRLKMKFLARKSNIHTAVEN